MGTTRLALKNIEETTTVAMGIPILDGRPDQGFLVLTFPEGFTYEESADGLLIRCKSNKTLVDCQMKLLGGSNANDLLSGIWIADQEAGGGAGVGPFLHKDNNGTTLISCSKSWVHQPAPFTEGAGSGERVWNIRMQMKASGFFIGGNSIV